MDIKFQANSVALVLRLLDKKKSTAPYLDFAPAKATFTGGADSAPLPRKTPEEAGIPSSLITEYLAALRSDRNVFPHTATIVRGGAVIAECSFAPYTREVWQTTYSMCKSVVSLAIGILVGEGKISLDDKIGKILDIPAKRVAPLIFGKQLGFTLRNLLTMSTGIIFNEAASVSDENWTDGFLTSLTRFEAGSRFSYNSMNTYILSAIVCKVSGMSLSEFLDKRIFGKMGIVNYCWEKSPEGIEKGGWGLYLLPEDMAKLGVLVMNGGEWKGEQLVPAAWISEATKKQISVPRYIGKYDYGYQFWVGDNPRVWMFNGMFGQNTLGFPDNDIVVTVTAGNNDMFQKNAFFAITERFFGKPFSKEPLPRDRHAAKALSAVTVRLAADPYFALSQMSERELTHAAKEKPAKKALPLIPEENLGFYLFDAEEGASLGVLPLMLQSVQNNYSDGTSGFGLAADGDGYTLFVREGKKEHKIKFANRRTLRGCIDIHGEKYEVAAFGASLLDERGYPYLLIRIAFLEFASERYIKIHFDSGTARTEWSETPSVDFLDNGALSIFESVSDKKILGQLTEKLDLDVILSKARSVFEYRINGSKV